MWNKDTKLWRVALRVAATLSENARDQFSKQSYSLISFQEYVSTDIESCAGGIIREESGNALACVCCSSGRVKARSRRKPPSRRSFQFQNCSPRNQSRVRMPRHTRNTLPLPLYCIYCCYITLTPILQIRRGSQTRRRHRKLRQTWDYSVSKCPSLFLGERFLKQFMPGGPVSSHANG